MESQVNNRHCLEHMGVGVKATSEVILDGIPILGLGLGRYLTYRRLKSRWLSFS